MHGLTHCRRNVGAPSDTLSPDSAQCAINRAGENSGHTLMLVPQEVLVGETPECKLPVIWRAFHEFNTPSPYLDDSVDLLPSGPQVAAVTEPALRTSTPASSYPCAPHTIRIMLPPPGGQQMQGGITTHIPLAHLSLVTRGGAFWAVYSCFLCSRM